MKKLVLATLLASIATVAVANTGYYAQGNLGYSKIEAKDDEAKAKDSGVSYSVALGKDTGVMRYQADYTNFGKIQHSGEESYTPNSVEKGESSLKTQSLGVSAIYDFNAVSGFVPYAGLRVGINQLKLDGFDETRTSATNTATIEYENYSLKKTQVGIGVLSGVQYAINPALAVDAGVEYNYFGKIDGVKVNQYGVKIGLRYNF